MDCYQSSSRTQLKLIGGVVHHHLWRTWREQRAYKERVKPALADAVAVVMCILDMSSCLDDHVSEWDGGNEAGSPRTTQEEPTRLVLVEFLRKVGAVTVQDRLASVQERDLQVEILQDLYQRGF